MAEETSPYALAPRSVFDAVGGCRVEGAGVVFDEAPARKLISLGARRGGTEALIAAVEKATGLTLPLSAGADGAIERDGATAIFAGPGQWLISSENEDLLTDWRERAGGDGALTDQSDAFVALTLVGPGARDVLARLSSLDFTDAAFPVGAAARTPMQQISVVIVRREDAPDGPDGAGAAPSFMLNTPRSTARDFAREVATAVRALEARATL